MKPVAVVTMVYNEAVKLPIWLRYYGDQFGRDSLYVVDNESTDGSTAAIAPSSVIHAPKTAKFERDRRTFIGDLCRSLLQYYDTVIYTDCDEILFPRKGRGTLAEFLAGFEGSHLSAIGLNLFQDVKSEGPIDLDRPILEQRAKAAFALPMCKTLVTRRPIEWSIGFHQCNLPPWFDDLFLLHLSNIDLDVRLERQAVMRPLTDLDDLGLHKRAGDDEVRKLFEFWSERKISPVTAVERVIDGILKGTVYSRATGFYGIAEAARSDVPKPIFRLSEIAPLDLV